MNSQKTRMAALMLAAGLSGTAHAALHDRGGGLVYDDSSNLTWLKDANYAATIGYDSDGRMTWQQALAWATNVAYYDSVRQITLTDWRLPTAVAGCTNYSNCGGEIGGLFNNLGGTTGTNIYGKHNEYFFLFTNIQQNYEYWSSTNDVSQPALYAKVFSFGNGWQTTSSKTDGNYAWLVREGDVAAAAVPEPETYAMLLGGLGLVGAAARRRRG